MPHKSYAKYAGISHAKPSGVFSFGVAYIISYFVQLIKVN